MPAMTHRGFFADQQDKLHEIIGTLPVVAVGEDGNELVELADDRPVERDVAAILISEFGLAPGVPEGAEGIPVWALKANPDMIRAAVVRQRSTDESLEDAWKQVAAGWSEEL